MRILIVFLFIFSFTGYSQKELSFFSINDSVIEINRGLLIIVEDGSCGLCFEKINSIKQKVIEKNDLPVFVIFTSLRLSIELRSSSINQNKKYIKGGEIHYLFMDQNSKLSFKEKYNLSLEPGSPFLLCISDLKNEMLPIYYSELFSPDSDENDVVKKIMRFFK